MISLEALSISAMFALCTCSTACMSAPLEEGDADEVASQQFAWTNLIYYQPLRSTSCTSSQYSVALNAFYEADKRISNADLWMVQSVIATFGPKPTDDWRRYIKWFGPPDGLATGSRLNRVIANIRRLKNALSGVTGPTGSFFEPGAQEPHWVINCSCTRLDAYAWVFPSTPWTIRLCPRYFNELPNLNWFGGLSQPGVLIHETSHFVAVADARDFAGEYAGAAALAASDPEAAIKNADNYAYFASNEDNFPMLLR
ncbi:MAG TPA: M35 family metallo-endopeptidase [Polyangiaceae bacterium]|nr:M35 family metallo-endopeptidase [Polyangiaceae bacterium]